MADVLAPNITKKYNLGPVKPYVQMVADIVGNKFGLKTIGGWRKSDPFTDHPSGNALDFMIRSKSEGDQIADYLIANASAFGLKYLIWNRRTYNVKRGTWAPYSGSNPHTDHVHYTGIGHDGADTSGLASALAKFSGGTLPVSTGMTAPAFNEAECAMALTLPSFAGAGPLPDVGGQRMCLMSKQQARVPAATFFFISATLVGLVGVTLLVVYGLNKSSTAADLLKLMPTGKMASKVASGAG